MNTFAKHLSIAAALAAALGLTSCGQKSSTAKNERAQNAQDTYVAPGEKDEYYLF